MKAAVTLLVATGRVSIMPKYQLTNPDFGEEEGRFEERTEDRRVGGERLRFLHLREIEWGRREHHHFDCWSWWARRLLIFFWDSTGGSGWECLERADLGKRVRDWRWRRRLLAAAAMDWREVALGF